MVRESLEPEQSVFVVTRRNGANQLFLWCKPYPDGSLSAVSSAEAGVPASELSDALKQIRELQRMLGKKDDGSRSPQRGRGDRSVAKMDCALALVCRVGW